MPTISSCSALLRLISLVMFAELCLENLVFIVTSLSTLQHSNFSLEVLKELTSNSQVTSFV